MSSPVTFSGFNGIDWSTILNSVMQQANEPLTALQGKQTDLQNQASALAKFTTQANTLQQAAKDLQTSTSGDATSASTTDASAVSVATTSGAVAGSYDVVVEALARAQVTASTSTAPDANTTNVATGGSLTIGGKTVTLTGAVTLQGLAKAINGTTDIGVTATVIQSAAGAYRLVLTGNNTGADNSFAISNDLTGSSVTFGGNAVEASDAKILVNNVEAVSDSNTFTDAIPGVTLTVLSKDLDAHVGVTVTANSAALKTRIDAFVKAYNDIVSFIGTQTSTAASGDNGNIANDPMLKQMRAQVRSALNGAYGSGAINRLSQLGIEFTPGGTLKFTATKLSDAVTSNTDDVLSVLTGASGAFGAIATSVNAYTTTSGLLSADADRIKTQQKALDDQISKTQDRLNLYKASLQQEFLAAEMAMSRLKAQSGQLGSSSS